ncbi:MAG: ATPase, T2SS/T4P/T4SS family [Oscillospiraceae bacterium]
MEFELNGMDNIEQTSYAAVLDRVQQYMTDNYSEMLKENATSDEVKGDSTELYDKERQIKRNIEIYIKENEIVCSEETHISALSARLYNSMCRYDFLTPYIMDDKFIEENHIEEINGNSWNAIYVTDKNGTHLIKEHFPSPTHAINTLNALATRLDKTLNRTTPIFLGEIRKNIRIACSVAPVVDAEQAVNFSIRIVSLANFTREDLIKKGTADDIMLNFLEMCISHNVNICFSGATFSGKTGSLGYLLSYIAKNSDKRIGTIEIEAREFNILRFDESGNALNNVFNWCTRESANERLNITSDTLEELILRFSPEIIAIGEMRNKEALITCEIGTTGHTVITTTHSGSAADSYDRIVRLCKKSRMGYDDDTLYRLALRAFPIICFQKRCMDKSRKITEIIEGTGYKDGVVEYRTLFHYEVESSTKELVSGKFVHDNGISDWLKKSLLNNEASKSEVDEFC